MPLAYHHSSTSTHHFKHQLSISALKHSSLSKSSRQYPSYGKPIISTSQTGYDFPSSVQIRQVDNDCPVIGDGIPYQDSFSEREVKALVLERSLVPEDAYIYSSSTIRRAPGCSDPICEYTTDTSPASCYTYDVLIPLSLASAFSTYPSSSGRRFQSKNEYYYTTSACSPWPVAYTEEDSSTSRDSCITEITISDFPLPPPSVSVLPSECHAGLSPKESLLA